MPQCETASVLLASPGSPGHLQGRVSTSLGQPGSVHIPSLSSGRSGDRPCPRVFACRDDSGCTPLAREGVVRRLTSTDPTTSRPALVGQSASAAPLQPLHQGVHPLNLHAWRLSSVISVSRVFREGLLESCQGVSDPPPHASMSRWQIFCGWCRGRGVAPVNATVPVVVDFLIHLRHDKGLSVCG